MPSVKVEIKVGECLRDLKRLQKSMDRNVAHAIDETGDAIVGFMRRNGYRDRTGNLSKSMRADVVRKASLDYRMTVGAYVKYALWVDQPTKPHPIDARRVPNLVFWWERMGCWFVGPHVDHPGTRGAFFSNQARKLGAPRLRNAINAAVDAAIKGGA